MLFTDGKLRDLEKFMCLPKYPTLKGGGRCSSSYHYTRNDCKCMNCLHWKKKQGCSQRVCPYIQERIDCGACSFDEIVHTVIEKTAPNGFVNADKQYNVELTYAGQNVKVTSTALSVYNERQRVSVSLSKIMEQNETFGIGNNNEILSVQFGVYSDEKIKAADGTVIPKDALITYGNCDENGKLTFNCDLPIGFKWYAKEMATDNHYILSDTKYESQSAK